MTEQDFPEAADFRERDEGLDGTPNGYSPATGDPSLELFSQGWTPTAQQSTDSYTGRHRAPEA
jgi:hypothetical protein